MSTNKTGNMKLGKLMESDYGNNLNASIIHSSNSDDNNNCKSNVSTSSGSPAWNQQFSPYINSPWTTLHSSIAHEVQNGLIGSLVRKEGHIYSLATYGDLLYTGSDSKNVRVWKNLKEFSGFKSSSGLVKSIVISNGVVYTGHQDGKIRIWRASYKNRSSYVRIGTLPSLTDSVKKSFNPKHYVEVRRGRRNVLKIKHFDAVSCLCLNHEDGDYDNDNEEALLLYSGSWDKTVKVWRVSDSKCIESIDAHDDAVNAVAVSGYDGLVLTGSADGKVKVWRREILNGGSRQRRVLTKHNMIKVLLEQESAITSLAVDKSTGVTYCGSSDGLVNFWKRDRRGWFVHGGVLRGHKLAVLCLAIGGNLVVSGSADKSICVWRREYDGDHTCLSLLTGHTGPVKCLSMVEDISYDTKRDYNDHSWVIYSGSLDKSVNVWRVSEQVTDYSTDKC